MDKLERLHLIRIKFDVFLSSDYGRDALETSEMFEDYAEEVQLLKLKRAFDAGFEAGEKVGKIK
jgi:hypothetical protein